MPVSCFFFLLEKTKPRIERQDTLLREAIPPGARLEATLVYLASGTSYRRLQYTTRISPASLSSIVPETCQAIYDALRDEFLQVNYFLGANLEINRKLKCKFGRPSNNEICT